MDEWTTYFASFLWTPSTSNPDSVWARGKFLLKAGIKLIFHVFFWWAPTCSHVAKIAQGLKGKVLRKYFVLLIKSLFFTFIHPFLGHDSTWCHLQCDCYDLNVKFLIFSKEFDEVQSIEVWSQEALSSLKVSLKKILSNMLLWSNRAQLQRK